MSLITYAFAALLSGQAAAAPPTSAEPTLEQVRAATERFKDVKIALAEGYVRDPMGHCVTAPDIGRSATEGAMGIHYIRMDFLGISGPPNPRVEGTGIHTDFNKPAILLYEPKADGNLELVGVENLVFKKAWAAAGNSAPPTYQGVQWNSMEDDPATAIDEGHMFVPHYDRHIWLYRTNPTGMYAQFNPNVSCAAFKPNDGAMHKSVAAEPEKAHEH